MSAAQTAYLRSADETRYVDAALQLWAQSPRLQLFRAVGDSYVELFNPKCTRAELELQAAAAGPCAEHSLVHILRHGRSSGYTKGEKLPAQLDAKLALAWLRDYLAARPSSLALPPLTVTIGDAVCATAEAYLKKWVELRADECARAKIVRVTALRKEDEKLEVKLAFGRKVLVGEAPLSVDLYAVEPGAKRSKTKAGFALEMPAADLAWCLLQPTSSWCQSQRKHDVRRREEIAAELAAVKEKSGLDLLRASLFD